MSRKRKNVEVTPDPTWDELSKRRAMAKTQRDMRAAIRNGDLSSLVTYVMILFTMYAMIVLAHIQSLAL